MSASVSCRSACEDDLAALLRLYAQPDLDDGHVLALPAARRVFARISRYPDYTIYVAVCEAQIVGTFGLLIMDNLAHMGAPSAIIEDVAVDPRWHRRGVGTLMMRYALRVCKAKGCYKAALSANVKREQAHGFYEALGFDRHGYSFRVTLGPE